VCRNVERFPMFPDILQRLTFTYTATRVSLFLVISRRVVVISYRRFGTTYRSRPQKFRIQMNFRVQWQVESSWAAIQFSGSMGHGNSITNCASSYSPLLHYLHLQLPAIQECKKESKPNVPANMHDGGGTARRHLQFPVLMTESF